MTTNEFLQKYRRVRFGMNVTRPRVKCADGYTVSIQAGYGIYSIPREDADAYEAVELGFPSKVDRKLRPYASCGVYGYVPVELVDEILQKHGGISEIDYSNGTGCDWEDHED